MRWQRFKGSAWNKNSQKIHANTIHVHASNTLKLSKKHVVTLSWNMHNESAIQTHNSWKHGRVLLLCTNTHCGNMAYSEASLLSAQEFTLFAHAEYYQAIWILLCMMQWTPWYVHITSLYTNECPTITRVLIVPVSTKQAQPRHLLSGTSAPESTSVGT